MTSDIALYEGGQVDGYRPQIMTPEAARALDEQVRLCTKAVLREGTDYGIIPGTGGEKSLWRPGAQKLLQWFGFSCTCVRSDIERDDEGRKHGITYIATVTRRLPDGTDLILATCEGTADYDETKFYQSAEQVKERLRGLENKWAEKDGRRPNPERWMNATEYRADWNALMKRAQKRAIVGAVVDATAAGGIFADREDDDPPVAQVQDDGPTWYEATLEAAHTFTDVEDGRSQYVQAAQAHRAGRISRRQQDHLQNIIRQRSERLKAHAQVDVTDLADSAAAAAADADAEASQDVPPAEGSPDGAAAAAGSAGGTRPPAKMTSGQKDRLKAAYERLGYDDDEEGWEQWLRDLAQLAGLAAIAAPTELLQAEAKRALDQLKGLDMQGLRRLLDNGEVPGE